jgi:hypothetical protein
MDMAFITAQNVKDSKTGKKRRYAYLVVNRRDKKRGMVVPSRKHLGIFDEASGQVSVSVSIAGHDRLKVAFAELKERASKGEDVLSWLAGEGERLLMERVETKTCGEAAVESVPVRIENVGVAHALSSLADSTGLRKSLESGFGVRDAESLLCLAVHKVATGHALFRAATWLEGSSLANALERSDLSSGGISRLTARVGEDADSLESFRKAWVSACGFPKALICDTTSLSSFSEKLKPAEFGYNRDCESLPQVNLIMVHARETGLPLTWRMVNGSVPDVATLRNTAAFLTEYGMKEFSFALDKGFCSKANMRDLSAAGLDFVLGVPFNSKWAEDLLKRKRIKLESMKRMFSFDGRELHHVSEIIHLDIGKASELKVAGHLFLDPLRRQDMLSSFKRRVMAVEEKAANEIFSSRWEAVEWLKENGAGVGRCLVVKAFQGTAKILHSPMRMARASSAMGYCLIAASDTGLSREQVLSDYRSRDAVEKLFDALKNELGSKRLRSGDEGAVIGRLLVDFLALVLRKSLENALRKAGLSKRLSVPEALDELSKVKAVVLESGRRIVLEIPSKAKGIISAAGASLPS